MPQPSRVVLAILVGGVGLAVGAGIGITLARMAQPTMQLHASRDGSDADEHPDYADPSAQLVDAGPGDLSPALSAPAWPGADGRTWRDEPAVFADADPATTDPSATDYAADLSDDPEIQATTPDETALAAARVASRMAAPGGPAGPSGGASPVTP